MSAMDEPLTKAEKLNAERPSSKGHNSTPRWSTRGALGM